MRWLDVAGSPASGKSTLCDAHSPRKVDGVAPTPPSWEPFLKCVASLVSLVDSSECATIVNGYVRKIAVIAGMEGEIYVNTGLAQGGLELGWRLDRPEMVADYFWLMPVSVGVVFLWADEETLRRRNQNRKRDRSHMVSGMERARAIGAGVLRSRGVAVTSLDTRCAVDLARDKLAGAA
jgi:hypothetical protein